MSLNNSLNNSKLDAEKKLRLKYYGDIKTRAKISSETFLKPPESYYINPNLFMVVQPSGMLHFK